MSGGQLNANVEQYRQAAALNTPPPQIVSDPLVSGATPIEQLLRVLGLAANLGDSRDNATSVEQHAERDAKTREAAEKFATQDEEAAAELRALEGEPYADVPGAAATPDQFAAMSQQLPQMASSIAGALAGAVGGALQPLAQIPQQAAQGVQQALQTGVGLFEQATSTATAPIDDTDLSEAPLDDLGGGTTAEDFPALSAPGGVDAGDIGAGGDLGGFGGVGATGGGGPGGTAPTSYLGPPPIPTASTAPSSAPVAPVSGSGISASAATSPAGMAGMPMVPPGSMAGAAGSDKEGKAETKRVSVPPVRNGAPVQGRLIPPPTTPTLTKKVDGQPIVTRRIVSTVDGNHSGDAKSDS